ncbi:MAG TPA: carboxypeptidase-like regulatory domain-containing protein [Fibrobacteria bacterium]|nr:carboxypeptidase-like regulatory domain-containing protein [Fibrobacteria bacterium]
MPFPSRIPNAAFRLLIAAALGLAGAAEAAITLTQVPSGMRKQTAEIALGWTGGQARVHLRASTVPGGGTIARYDSLHLPSQPGSGSYAFKVNPDIPAGYRNTDLRFGINYCILTDGAQASPEFVVIIESGNAPVLGSPANAAAIKDLTPTFSWTGDAPFYALLLSDEPFRISDDGTVSGVSAIWQIITPYTTVRYGDPDPSGFNTVPAPPLISGKTYNWLVLNNYGNNSASTSKVAPVPASFVYSPSAPLPAARLLEPEDQDSVPGTDQILFRWTQVDGAVSYKIELLEENLVDGSQADIALWKASSTGGQITLDNATGLLRRFNYKWRVYAVGSNGSASLSEKRSFFYDVDVGNISVTVKDDAGRKVAYAPVKLNRLGGASSAVFQGGSTDNDGLLSIKNAPLGSYEARIENLDGYLSETDTIVHAGTGGTSKTITLSPVLGKILGKVASAAGGTGVLNAKVAVTGADGTQWTASTNSQGNYSLGVPFGNWQVRAQADGFAAAGAVSVSLNGNASSKTADFALAPNKFTLSGTVRNSFSRQGIFGAVITLTQADGTRSANTDGNGGFSFSVPGGAVSLRVSSPGFASPEPLSVDVDGDKSINLALDPNASIIAGRTRDASGTALANAIVQATPKAGPVRSVVSDGQGAYEISLPAGDWILSGSAKGFSSGSLHKFLLDVSKTVQGVDLVFEPNRSFLSGRVTVNGSGLAGARISAGEAAALSDNAGYYLLSVNAGTQSVLAAKDGYLIPKTYAVPVNPGDTAAGIDFAASGNAGLVKGRALAGGAGVVGATIQAINQSNQEIFQRTTDGDGAYALSLPGAEYKLTASREGFALDQVLSFSLASGGTLLDADLRLLPDQGGITGTVASGSASLGGCEVAYRNVSNPGLAGRTVTDPLGRYSLSLQAGAAYALTASCPGYQAASSVTEPLVRGGGLSRDFNLAKAGASFKGKVMDVRGALLSGVKVTAEKAGEAVTAVSDFAGSYAFSLGAGTYSLAFSKPGYRTVSRSVQLALGENAAAAPDTLAASVGRLAGRVVSEGSGVAGALLTLVGLSPDAGGGTFTTDADGRFAGDNLPAGNYGLSASAEGYSDGKLASLTVVAGQAADAEIVLAANRGVLAGSVKADGTAAANATVAANAYGVSRSVLTRADGTYRIEKLPPGIYSVSAALAGFSPDKVHEGQSLASGGVLTGLDFGLARNVGSLSGTVTGTLSAAGVRIAIAGKKGFRAYAACDGSGKYAFPSLPADTYAMSIAAPGYKLAGSTQTPEIGVTGPAEYNPALLPAVFRLAGKILNQADAGIAGLPVELRISQDKLKTVSGADGAYAFPDVPAGQEYQLSCKPPTADYDARDTTFALDVNAPSQVTANLRTLSRVASLSGTVSLDDAPVEGATIRLSGNGNNLTAISQPNGAFKVFGVAGSAAPVSLTVAKAGAKTLDTALTVPVGEARSGLTARLKTLKLALAVTLRDSEGKILPGAKVVVASPRKLDTLATASDGTLSVAGIPANQSLTLASLLDKALYDNVEASVFLKEKDTLAVLEAKVHASVVIVRVRDQNGDAVDGADVLLNGKSLGKTSQGESAARNLARGTYRLAAGKAAYKSGADAFLTVSGDTSATVTLSLARVEGGLYGTVSDSGLDQGGGAPAGRTLPGAVVTARAGTDTLRDTVNSLGQYSLSGMADGVKYALSLTLPGYQPLLDSAVGGPQAQNRDLRLRPFPGTVLGRVEGGKAGVRLILSHAASGQVSVSATRPGGYFAFTGLQNRSDYSLQAVDGSSSSQAVPFQAGGGAAKRIDLALDRWGGVAGTVKGGAAEPGSPVAGALVSVRNALSGVSTWTLTDSLGGYSLAGLASGAHELSVERKGYLSPKGVSLSMAKGTLIGNVDFLLAETEAGISGRVADGSGRGLAATVRLARGQDTLKAETDGSGQFVFGGQGPGTYGLSASKPGYDAPAPVQVAYAGKGLETRNLVLVRRGNLIQGQVRDALTNTPEGGALVSLLSSPPASATADSLGRFELAAAAGSVSPLYLEASLDGYLTRTRMPVYLDADGSAVQDIALTADYRFDGEIAVSVKEGKDPVAGLFLTVQSFHPDDSLRFSITGQAPNSFRELRRPAPYTLKVKREGFKDLVKVVELTAKSAALDVALSYPTSQIRVFVTSDGKRGKGVDLSLNGEKLRERADTAGLFASAAKLKSGSYEVVIRDPESGLIPLAPYFIALGEDSVRTDTLSQPFFAVPIPDSIIGAPFSAQVRRADSLHPAAAVVCSLYYRPVGDPLWRSALLPSVAGGFSGPLPEQSKAGIYEYYHVLRSPSGARIGTVTAAGNVSSSGELAYSDVQAPGRFSLRDPFLLNSIALSPQRLEADTSLYSLGARDLWQVQMRSENGRSLDAYFDRKRADGDTGFTVSWSFADPARAAALGLSLVPEASASRTCRFRGGFTPSDTVFQVVCTARMGAVRLKKAFAVKIQDLTPVSIAVRYVKENRVLEEDGASLPVSNRNPAGYQFSAFAKTAEGREFNIAPRWSFGADSVAGTLSQAGLFIPDSSVARSAALRIYDTLQVAATNAGEPVYKAFTFLANLATYTQVVPSAQGRALVTDGEGAFLDFNLAGLSKAFTVSVKKPKVSGLLRASPQEEVVGDILDIELSEHQPFKADSGATLKMPVASGIARRRTVFLGHWNSSRPAWEKVDSASGDTSVAGKVYSFSKYAVIMGSLPLGAYDFIVTPNPFTCRDPWGLQLGYKVSSDVSSQVGVRVEVYNMMGDKVYESQETQLSKGQIVQPGVRKADVNSAGRKIELGPFVWDGHDNHGAAVRNGRYMLKLIVKDGRGSKEYLKKVVMLK